MPRAILPLAGEDPGAEPFAPDTGPLRGSRRGGSVRQITRRLPANGRVRLEEPRDVRRLRRVIV